LADYLPWVWNRSQASSNRVFVIGVRVLGRFGRVTTFMKDVKGNLAKAQAYYSSKHQ
jgi:hypothetical protein